VLTRAQKEDQVAELKDKLGRATSVFVADYRGVSVQGINQLRSKLRSEGEGAFEYQVTKNSLLRLAVADTDAVALSDQFTGPTAVAFSYGDPIALAKLLVDYTKEHEVFELKGGYLDGRAIDAGEVATLATLPSLDGIRSILVGLVQAPATKLVRLLAEPGAQLARLVEARRGALEESGGA
jgi:large subunit ribosomal protein L10